MSAVRSEEIADMLTRMNDWPAEQRLARRILQTIEGDLVVPPPRSKTLKDLLGLLRTNDPPPSDEECRRILEDELLREHG